MHTYMCVSVCVLHVSPSLNKYLIDKYEVKIHM